MDLQNLKNFGQYNISRSPLFQPFHLTKLLVNIIDAFADAEEDTGDNSKVHIRVQQVKTIQLLYMSFLLSCLTKLSFPFLFLFINNSVTAASVSHWLKVWQMIWTSREFAK